MSISSAGLSRSSTARPRMAMRWGCPSTTRCSGLAQAAAGRRTEPICVHLQGPPSGPGEYEDVTPSAQAGRDHQRPMARSAAHLGQLAPAEWRAHLSAAGTGRLEIGVDGAPLCAHVGQAFAALCRPADFWGHTGEWRKPVKSGWLGRSQKWSQWEPSTAPVGGRT